MTTANELPVLLSNNLPPGFRPESTEAKISPTGSVAIYDGVTKIGAVLPVGSVAWLMRYPCTGPELGAFASALTGNPDDLKAAGASIN